ncbi:MAG TPA: phosphotransferase [Paraburkholderia sp.]|nr:phosphotransferase [Paraburkholderia sp.]
MSTIGKEERHLFDVARLALRHWGWPGNSELKLLKFRENAVFSVFSSAAGKRVALRLHRPHYHSRQALISELKWMDALHAAGIPVPRALPNSVGELLVSVAAPNTDDVFWVDMLEWIDGAPVGSAEERTYAGGDEIERIYRELGKLAARIHEHSAKWTPDPEFWRPSWDLAGCIGVPSPAQTETEPLWGRYTDLQHLSDEQRSLLSEAAEIAADLLTKFGIMRDRYGLVHSDLVPDNLMQTPNGLVVIDFDDCGYGWYLWELGTAVFWHLGEPTYDFALRGYVAGYRSVRDLPDEHLSMIPAVLLIRALVYLGWMHTRRHTEPAVALTPHVVAISVRLAADLISRNRSDIARADAAPFRT